MVALRTNHGTGPALANDVVTLAMGLMCPSRVRYPPPGTALRSPLSEGAALRAASIVFAPS